MGFRKSTGGPSVEHIRNPITPLLGMEKFYKNHIMKPKKILKF